MDRKSCPVLSESTLKTNGRSWPPAARLASPNLPFSATIAAVSNAGRRPTRGYDAGATSRVYASWIATSSSIDASRLDGLTIRERAERPVSGGHSDPVNGRSWPIFA
jgi:hypothetical protein